jgi:hypothetical protein
MAISHDELLIAEYAEAGEWARHYSSVRMGVPTFLIGVSVLLITDGWKDAEWIYLLSSVLTWVAAIAFLLFYTGMTLRDVKYQKQIRGRLDPKFAERHAEFKPPKPEHSAPDGTVVDLRRPARTLESVWNDVPCFLAAIFTAVYIWRAVEFYYRYLELHPTA